MRSVTCHIVILGLVDGRSDTQYTVSRNSHTIYACVAVQCPYGSTGTTIRKKLDSFFIKGGTVVSGKFGTAGTFALLQNIQIRGLRFDILGKGVPQITAYDLSGHGSLVNGNHKESLMSLSNRFIYIAFMAGYNIESSVGFCHFHTSVIEWIANLSSK